MVSKNYYLTIVLGAFTIFFTSFLVAYLIFKEGNITLGVLLSLVVLTELYFYVYSLNHINRKIASFFSAVYNEDTSIRFNRFGKGKIMQELEDSLNKAIKVFQSVSFQSEYHKKMLMTMIENSATGFISLDEFGDFEVMNDKARKLLGAEYTSNLERLKAAQPELYDVISEINSGESKVVRISRNNNYSIIQVSSTEIKYMEKKLVLVSLQDIRKEIEAKEMESWQKLIKIMNHEIMNSIAPITSVSKTLGKYYEKNGKPITREDISDTMIRDTVDGLEVIESMSTGLNRFVEQYRKLSKMPQPVIKQVVLERWVSNLETMCNEVVRKNGAELLIHNSGIKEVECDEGLLNQVIINLVKNAAEAPESDQAKKIKLEFEPSENRKVLIKVSNNGMPVEQEVLDRVFVPFFTTKENGAGIGLFISRQIISLHQGTISVVSDEGAGTCFSIEL